MMMKPVSLTFALDCSLKKITLALFSGDSVQATAVVTPDQPQSAILLKKIVELFDEGGCSISQVQSVLYANGPGSFTSLRVGLATLKGLFWQKENVKFFSVSSLLFRCLSAQKNPDQDVMVLMPLGRDQFAAGFLSSRSLPGFVAGQEFKGRIYSEAVLNQQALQPLMDNIAPDILLVGEAFDVFTVPKDAVTVREDVTDPQVFPQIFQHGLQRPVVDLSGAQIHYGVKPQTK